MFESKGKRLEDQGKYREAAQWYEEKGKYLNAAKSYEHANDFGNAFVCYRRAGESVKVFETLWRVGFDQVSDFLMDYSDLTAVLVPRYIGSDWIRPRDWAERFLRDLAQSAPTNRALAFLSKFWKWVCHNLDWCRQLKYLTMNSETDIMLFLKVFANTPFADEVSQRILEHLRVCNGHGGGRLVARAVRVQSRYPILSFRLCEWGLKNRDSWLLPIAESYEGARAAEEALWIEELEAASLEAHAEREGVECLVYHGRFGDAADLLERMGKCEEALAILDKSGPANFRWAKVVADWETMNPEDRKRYWSQRMEQLRGRIAVSQTGRKEEAAPPSIDVAQLEQRLALGEISVEEFEAIRQRVQPS